MPDPCSLRDTRAERQKAWHKLVLNAVLKHLIFGVLNVNGVLNGGALTRNLEAKQGKREEKTSLVIHRAGNKWLGLSTLAFGNAFLISMIKTVHNNHLALQLGQWHFSLDFIRSCVWFLWISVSPRFFCIKHLFCNLQGLLGTCLFSSDTPTSSRLGSTIILYWLLQLMLFWSLLTC